MVVGGNVVPRPMMYIALTYDHRLIDGREAVFFLRSIKDVVEDPRRLLLDIWRSSMSCFLLSFWNTQMGYTLTGINVLKWSFVGFNLLINPLVGSSIAASHDWIWNERSCYRWIFYSIVNAQSTFRCWNCFLINLKPKTRPFEALINCCVCIRILSCNLVDIPN